MTPPLTSQPELPMEPPTAAEAMSTQLFGVLYITLTGMVDTMVPNSGPWSFLGPSVSYVIKLAPLLWWALSTGRAAPRLEAPNASAHARLPDSAAAIFYNKSYSDLQSTPGSNHWMAVSCQSS
ncbi:hypothetical protein DSO57_1000591 [Entomophthora muscae]|uniref:Uncharacterized protein n=1 Tax=Entomophthora muscae TaxID=34485 RepID=A0ACC2S0G7_9FUNG|nr:hypothetical protein DSO57_1000591 [Entomophthora muscae]